jgi:hypothetical protein
MMLLKVQACAKDAVVTYQKKFKEAAKSWNLNSITTNTNDFQLNPVGSSTSTLDNSSNQNLYNAKFDYSLLKFSDEGKISFGALYEELLLMQEYGTTNFYKRRTTASYLEFQTKFDKINFIVVVVPKITT